MTHRQLLQTIDEAALKGLTTLDLNGKGISRIPPQIANLSRLKRLDLSKNKLTNLPLQLFTLANLVELRLRENAIATLPRAIGNLTRLSTLDIANNRLKSLPAEIGRLSNLVDLKLGGNQISKLPPDFDRLSKLEVLGLMGNNLHPLPLELTRLTNLRKLNLGRNKIATLPAELSDLTALTELHLADNNLKTIPASIGKLISLAKIDISGNPISSIPIEAGELFRLETLNARETLLPLPKQTLDRADAPTELLLQCVFPDLQQREEPYIGDWEKPPAYRFQYEDLPELVIWRFILLKHASILKRTYWRNGVVLSDQQNIALVTSNSSTRELAVYIAGPWKTRTTFASNIRTSLQAIHDSLSNLHVKETATVNDKLRVFIGSSTEGKRIAEAIQAGLEYDTEPTIWSQGVFGLSQGTLETLVGLVSRFDYAILVLTPDDVTRKRDTSGNTPRDNVLFELGLFMGALGRDHVFIVHGRDSALQLPTDLAGVTAATFAKRTDGNLDAAVGPAVTKLKHAMGLT
jgi:predicted nucleotide-binding protein